MLTIAQINEVIQRLRSGIKRLYTWTYTEREWDDAEENLKQKLSTLINEGKDYGLKDPAPGVSVDITLIKQADDEKLEKLTNDLEILLTDWKAMIKKWDLCSRYNTIDMQEAVKLFDKYEKDYQKQLKAENQRLKAKLERIDQKAEDFAALTSELYKLSGKYEVIDQLRVEKENENKQLLKKIGVLHNVAMTLNDLDDRSDAIKNLKKLTFPYIDDDLLRKPSSRKLHDVKEAAPAKTDVKTATATKPLVAGAPPAAHSAASYVPATIPIMNGGIAHAAIGARLIPQPLPPIVNRFTANG